MATWCATFVESILCLRQKKYRGVMCHNTEEWCKIWGKTDFEKMTWEIWGILTSALGSLKVCILMGSFWAKYIMYELKNCEGHDNEGWCNILIKKLIGGLKNDLKVVSATFVLV